MYNKVILMGRICHDLELRTVQGSISVVTFSIAVDRSYQTRGEERKSDFFRVVAWRSTAEFICRNFGKGNMIMLDGELQSRQYVDKNGINQTVVEIIADRVSFTGERVTGSGVSGGNYPPPPPENSYGGGKSQSRTSTENNTRPQEDPAVRANGSAEDFADAEEDDYPF